MGSFSVAPYATPIVQLVPVNYGVTGDQIILTVDGVNLTFTVQDGMAGDGPVTGLNEWAASINAWTATNPKHGLPMNQVIFANASYGRYIGVQRAISFLLISTRLQFSTAVTVSYRVVPAHSTTTPLSFNISRDTTNYLVTVTEPIASGTVLTTSVDGGVVGTYTVTSNDTAATIAAHAAASIKPTIAYTTRVDGSTFTLINTNHWEFTSVTTNVTPPVSAEKPALYVSGQFLYDRHGNQAVLRGVNYAPLDTYEYPGIDYLDQVLQTGANAVRIAWWITYPDPNRPPYSLSNLANLIDRCIAADVVPIVQMAQIPCATDTSPLNAQLIPWWTSAAVTAVLLPRQSCLILNLANELGEYEWTNNGDANAALAQYVKDYTTAIAAMRKAGYVCPLMIDAPDCGISNQVFTLMGTTLVKADGNAQNNFQGNILLSTHAYWAGYDGTQEVAKQVALGLPIIFGEVANKEGDPPHNLPIYDLDGIPVPTYVDPPTGFNYERFLIDTLLPNGIGWLMWSWFPDDVDERNMSSDGSYASLTAYGKDVVGNATYGLKTPGVVKKITP